MSQTDDTPQYTENVLRFSGNIRRPPPPGAGPLNPTGGGGTFDGMEARVARLEADVANIKDNVGELKIVARDIGKSVAEARESLATLTERVGHLPSKGFIVGVVITGVGLVITALTLLSKLGWLVAGAAK